MSSFFLTDTATPELYPLSLHDALPISRGGGDAVVVLRGAGPLHPRSAAAASARRARHQPALLVQLRHCRRSLRPVRARRALRQSHHVSRRREKYRDSCDFRRAIKNNSSSMPIIIQVDVSLARYARVKTAAALQAAV